LNTEENSYGKIRGGLLSGFTGRWENTVGFHQYGWTAAGSVSYKDRGKKEKTAIGERFFKNRILTVIQ
jgi:hypothetical protein